MIRLYIEVLATKEFNNLIKGKISHNLNSVIKIGFVR